MRNQTVAGIFLLFGLGLGLGASAEQDAGSPRIANSGIEQKPTLVRRDSGHALNSDDRLSVLAAALDSSTPVRSEHDCSHLVHAIYERAGLPYAYAPSSDLYAGIEQFQRVGKPQPGDLIVWRGHTGIVVTPAKHKFFSFLRGGPGIDDYESPYWKSRGKPRFYRYINSSREIVRVRHQ